ncbi:piggyBac transposable element-derived protein 4-like, partial [Periplaneta americana]|uniref:piggyBac transposable element-derived protein 4-like n=1 Tax=Periplaneta americana TaxID=6978 RepID=UPI0037E76C6F
MKVFLGLLFHMGMIQMPRIHDYWKKDPLFKLDCFSTKMSRNHFLLTLWCLHFATNPKPGEPNPHGRLVKIKSMLDLFNNTIDNVYYLGKNLSPDESMVLWRGHLIFRQYIKRKRYKYGIKLYMLTEDNGMVLRILVYTGQIDNLGGKVHASNVVLKPMDTKLNVGHVLYMDNFYNSYDLALQLLQADTYCTGILCSNLKNNPDEVTKSKLQKGECKCQYAIGVAVTKWKDKRDNLFISTEYEDSIVETVNKRRQKVQKPHAIEKYNHISGVNLQDQMFSYYPCERKTVRWYKKIGIHLFQIMLLNAHNLHSQYTTRS